MAGDIKTFRIIVIDDEKDMVEILRLRLESKNFSVTFAYDGLSGLEAIRRERPDLIILDIIMPKMDGRDVLIELKKDNALKNIPVVMLTCKREQFERDYGFGLGADAYIEKPYEPDVLFREIGNLLQKNKEGLG